MVILESILIYYLITYLYDSNSSPQTGALLVGGLILNSTLASSHTRNPVITPRY